MPAKGSIWDEEYREKYYSSPKVQIHLEVFRTLVKEPKSEQTKQKMSIAKRDIPKTDEQKRKMSETQKKRHQVFKQLKLIYPELSRKEIWPMVKGVLSGTD